MEMIPALKMKTLPFVQNVVSYILMTEVFGFAAIVARTGTISNAPMLKVRGMFLNYSAAKYAKTGRFLVCLIIIIDNCLIITVCGITRVVLV